MSTIGSKLGVSSAPVAFVASAVLAGCGWSSASVSISGGSPPYESEVDGGTDCESPLVTEPASVLVEDPNVSPALAVTSNTLFWLDRGEFITDSIQALPLAGGPPTTIYSASPDPTAAIEDLVTDGTNLYFVQVSNKGGSFGSSYASQIEFIPLAGGTPTVLISADTDDLVLTLAGGYVYFSNGSTLQRVPTKGGYVDTVLGGTIGAGIASNGGNVYWTSGDGNLVTAVAGGKTETLVTDQQATTGNALFTSLVANAKDVFWPCTEDSGAGILCGTSASGDGVVRILSDLPNGSSELAADDTSVYFVESTNCTTSLEKVAVAGGTPVTIASGFNLVTEPTTAHAIALDDTYVYWSGSGQVFRAPK